jgi:hypothetical protein
MRISNTNSIIFVNLFVCGLFNVWLVNNELESIGNEEE